MVSTDCVGKMGSKISDLLRNSKIPNLPQMLTRCLTDGVGDHLKSPPPALDLLMGNLEILFGHQF